MPRRTRRAGILATGALLFVFASAPPAAAVYSITKIARTGEAAPVGGNYAGFGFINLNNSGEAAFVATLTGTPSSAIFLHSAGSTSALVTEGTAAPGTGGGSFAGFLSVALNDSGDISFGATVTGGTATHGFFRKSGASITAVAVTGDAAPILPPGTYLIGSTSTTTSINSSGDVDFGASLAGSTSDEGLFVDSAGIDTKTVLLGETAPGTGGEVFTILQETAGRSLADNGDVIFHAWYGVGGAPMQPSDQGIFKHSGGTLSEVLLEGDAAHCGGTHGGFIVGDVNAGGDVLYSNGLNLYRQTAAGEETRLVATSDTADGGGVHSLTIQIPGMGDAGDVIFRSLPDPGGAPGLYVYNAAARRDARVARAGDPVPGVGGVTFSNFPLFLMEVNANDQAFFTSALSDVSTGLFLAEGGAPTPSGFFDPRGEGLEVTSYMRNVPSAGGGPTYAFQMGRYEVTVGQFVEFLNSAEANSGNELGEFLVFDASGDVGISGSTTASVFDISLNGPSSCLAYDAGRPVGSRYSHSGLGAAQPIVGVSWIGALKFTNWLTLWRGFAPADRCYTEGNDVGDWHPVSTSAASWAVGDLSPAERQDLVDDCPGFRLPMDDLGGFMGNHIPNQESAYNERYQAAARNSAAPNTPRFDGIVAVSPKYSFYGFGRDSLSGIDANYLASGDPRDDTDTAVRFYDGESGTTNETNGRGLYDFAGNVAEWGQDQYSMASFRRVRFGSFLTDPAAVNELLASYAGRALIPDAAFEDVGFRIMRMPPGCPGGGNLPEISAAFEITGTSTGVGWSWSVDNGAFSGQVPPVGPGGSAVQITNAWLASVNNRGADCPGAVGGAQSSNMMAVFVRALFPGLFEFCVGDYGTIPLNGDPNSCCMSPGSNDVCSFNPTVTLIETHEDLFGTAQGGTVSADVDGQLVVIATQAGQSAATVAENLAEAIRTQTSFNAVTTAGSVFVSGVTPEDFSVTVNDQGLSPHQLPALGPWSGALALCLLFLLTGIVALRGRWLTR